MIWRIRYECLGCFDTWRSERRECTGRLTARCRECGTDANVVGTIETIVADANR